MRSRGWLFDSGVLAVVLCLWRIPSLLEPPWSADEGAYADIGRLLDHGATLYRTVWDNKPPGIYWLAALANARGVSVLAMQFIAFAAVGIGAVLVYLLTRRLTQARWTPLVAALLYITLASLPALAGDQLNTELPASVPVTAAVLVLLRRRNTVRALCASTLLAGGLVGVGFLFDLRVGVDLLIVPVVSVVLLPGGAAQRRREQAAAVLSGFVGFAVICAAAALALAFSGSLSAFITVVVHNDVGYATYFQAPAAFGIGTQTPSGSLSVVVGLVRIVLTLLLGAVIAWRLHRHGASALSVCVWWLTCDIAAATLDARGFTHYAQLVAASSAVAATVLAATVIGPSLWRRGAALVMIALTVPLALAVVYVPPAVGALANRQPLPPRPSLAVSATLRFLERGWGRALGVVSASAWNADFVTDVYPHDLAVAALIDARTGPSQPCFIWGGGGPWTYALADRVSSSRYVWLNSAFDVDPSAQSTALADIGADPPAILIEAQSLPSQLVAFLDVHGYARLWSAQAGTYYWLAG